MQDTLETLEKSLIQVVMNSQKLLQEFEKNKRGNLKIILLVGITGAGKSTLFNFLSGAEFNLRINNYEEELVLKTNGKNFSIMKEGMQSVTKEPNYYFNEEYNHLLIDFPGFHDTEGEMTQLIIQMLFFKIVTQYPIKIVYVLRHPENSLGDRGVGLQEFINSQFKEQKVDSSKFTIILNSYTEKLSEEALKKRFIKQLEKIYQKVNDKVLVIRKATNQEELLTQFSNQSRVKLWMELIQSHEIIFQPIILSNSQVVSKYLREKSNIIIGQYCIMINDALNLEIQILNVDQILHLQNNINQLINILSTNSNGNMQQWLNSLLKQFEILSQLLNCQGQFRQNSQEFIQIFNFFYQFQDFIEGFQDCEKQGLLAKSQCNRMQQIIFIKLQQLTELNNNKQKISDITQNLEQIKNQRNKLEQEYQIQIANNKDNQWELQKLETQFQHLKRENEQQQAKYQKELKEQQRKYDLALEQRRKQETENQREIENLKKQMEELEQRRILERQQDEERRRNRMIEQERMARERQQQINRLEEEVERESRQQRQRSRSNSCQLI